jgi:diamine N-acetyltransferase
MDVRLRNIDRSNWEACVRLQVLPEQQGFVALNAYSLAQAAYEPDACPMGIYSEGELAGFIMWDFDSELNMWGMCRLMVDQKLQGKGIGRAAVEKLLALVTAKIGHIPFYTSAEPENVTAIHLYEQLGFQNTGRLIDGEVLLIIQL